MGDYKTVIMVKTYLYPASNGKLAKAPVVYWLSKPLSIFSSFIKRTLYDIQKNLFLEKVEVLKKVPNSDLYIQNNNNNKKENNK